MQGCYYDCVNGQLVLLSGNCTVIPCPTTAGPCSNPGTITFRPCSKTDA